MELPTRRNEMTNDPGRDWNVDEWLERLVYGNSTGMPVETLLSTEGDIIHALLYAHLIWPRFIEVDGSVLCLFPHGDIGRLQDSFRDAKHENARSGARLVELEESFNEVAAMDVFAVHGRIEDDLEAHAWRELFAILEASWRSKLELEFPHRRFRLAVEDGPRGTSLRFSEVR